MTAAVDLFSLEEAKTIVSEILALPGVARMHPGAFGEVALLYPRERVPGLRIIDDPKTDQPKRIEVHIVANLSALANSEGKSETTFNDLSDEIRKILSTRTPLSVDVLIADVNVEGVSHV